MICGIDEAGRGPLAGPVYAAAVMFNFACGDCTLSAFLNDSKKMSENSRNMAFDVIVQNSFYAISFATHTEIDELNILQASLLAMKRAFSLLYREVKKEMPQLLQEIHVIVDGNKVPHFDEDVRSEAVVRADAKIAEVMAASILAKVARDRKMIEYAKLYPKWHYEKHKGYPTKAHIKAIREHGESPIQRKSFKYKM